MIYSYTVLVLQQLVSGQQCGTVGRVGNTRPGNNRARNQFFIDRGNRAGCAGMITSLSYCFHQPPGNAPPANQYRTTVAVYRPASTNENEFTNVSSPITIQKSVIELQTELNAANFACSVFNLPQPVPMETGDVLGACVFDPASGVIYRLDIVSRAASGSEDIVRTNTQPSTPAGCSATTVPGSFDVGDSDNSASTDRSLHLWANIGKFKIDFYYPHALNTPITEQDTTEETTTEEPGPLIGDSTTATTNRGTTSNPDATTAQPIGGGGGGSNVATIAIAVVVVLIVVVSLAAVMVIVIVLVSKRLKKEKSYEITTNSVGKCTY